MTVSSVDGSTSAPACAGLILCGGRSLRMGRPKAGLPFGGESMLARVARLVAASASPVMVVAAPGQELPGLPPDILVIRDPVEGRGPLEGLLAGLEALDEGLVYVTSTDAPFLAPGWIGRLAELIGDADLAIARHDGRLQPLAALYRRGAVLPLICALREQGRSRLLDLADAARARVVEADELRAVDPDLATLINANTPDEYLAALRRPD